MAKKLMEESGERERERERERVKESSSNHPLHILGLEAAAQMKCEGEICSLV